ncbi:ribose 5-phosphate isomerase B [Actinoallomurus bryophytorum]|uniref:Ribose 5-phosphate isomerase B n=1 Tax=Actinoallomurus bryophytorum TaxID=1490222 RepID=A0A543CJ00_9ACTN|nr:ribose 5-phosphate isomerase B [Actinoallomurus bryophytorum]TQL97010.1 ribose 5-phosphate isomerase B [Actinoallomurus bryophytorum]
MRIAIGSDHAGIDLKTYLFEHLNGEVNTEIIDVGTTSRESVDYPPFCFAVAELVAREEADWGIVLGGSGQGEMIAANKVCGIRAALCNSPYFAKLARRDNDANVLAIGARVVAPELAVEIVDCWRETGFSGERHARRIGLISAYENRGRVEKGSLSATNERNN